MRFLPLLALPIVTTLTIAACSDSTSTSPPATEGDGGVALDGALGDGKVTLSFEAKVGDAPFSCATPVMVGTPASMVEPLDFRLYVHDVRLIDANGEDVPMVLADDGKWQYGGVALLDFEDKSGTCANGTIDVNKTLVGSAPAGVYTGVKFKIGVPFELNHADVATAPSPLNLSGLFWSWNGGYKFARIDARGPAMDGGMGGDAGGGGHGGHGDEPGVFNIHLGSTGCTGDPGSGTSVTACAKPNIGEVVLTGFDPTKKKIVADFKALVAGSNLGMDMGGAPGCMSGPTDPECPNVLSHLGVDPSSGQPDAKQQTLFRAE
jgi:uncharacterized repeat protein (TIGR04052 family)